MLSTSLFLYFNIKFITSILFSRRSVVLILSFDCFLIASINVSFLFSISLFIIISGTLYKLITSNIVSSVCSSIISSISFVFKVNINFSDSFQDQLSILKILFLFIFVITISFFNSSGTFLSFRQLDISDSVFILVSMIKFFRFFDKLLPNNFIASSLLKHDSITAFFIISECDEFIKFIAGRVFTMVVEFFGGMILFLLLIMELNMLRNLKQFQIYHYYI